MMTKENLISRLVQSIWYDLSKNDVWEWDGRGIEPYGMFWINKWSKYYQGGEDDMLDEAFMDKNVYSMKKSLKKLEEKRNPFFGRSYKIEIEALKLNMWDVIKEHPFIVELMDLIQKYEPEFYQED